MRSRPSPVVVGVADHGGWAVLVSVDVIQGRPTVVDRRRVIVVDEGLPTQPYHHDTLALNAAAAERLVRRVQRSIAACTARAFDELATDLAPRYAVSGIAMREPTLPGLPATVRAAHASYHVMCRADGMLYHSAICGAAERRGWTIALCHRGDELARAARALRTAVPAVERVIRDVGRTLGSPWTADHRWALAAAIAASVPPE